MSWLTPDWISAIGTVAAVALALCLFFWERRSERATLTIRVIPEPPEWSFASLATEAPEDPARNVFVLRLAAENGGPAAARAVEAAIHQVEHQKNGVWMPTDSFLPSNLRWTHTADRQLQLLIPGAPKLFDLGEVQQNGLGDDCILVVAITPQPTRAYNVLFPGVYRLNITLAAENAAPAAARFELSFFPKWSSSDDTAIRQGITLTRLRT